MTLARQLFTGIIVAFIVLLAGIEAIYVTTAKRYLEEQLDAHANETATSLALSLGARATALDASLINIMVNPVFDRGHFELIEVRSPGGERLFGRVLESGEADVPAWFTALVPLKGPRGEALVSAGWKQFGKVIVQVHPGYAYRQLYSTASATLVWLIALFGLALVGVRYYLAGILKPLEGIEQTALAISNRNFVSIAVEPSTRELARVTRAMNSLSAKIRDVITQESEHAERLRRDAFEDPLTGQLNRRGFEQSVTAVLDGSAEVHSGALALFSVSGLEDVNRLFGLARGNAILSRLADSLAAPGAHGSVIVGRWQGPALAAFVANIGREAAFAWAAALCTSNLERLREEGMPADCTVSCGLAVFSEDSAGLPGLAQAAEGVLAEAVKRGGAVLAPLEDGVQAHRVDLRQEIESAIGAGRITLLAQNVISIADVDILQVELFCSLTGSDGKAISAGTFVPLASQHGLLAALDAKVIEQALIAMGKIESLPWVVSVNVSMQSIGDEVFRATLGTLLAKNLPLARRLVFEITGYAASRSPDLTRAFAAELRKSGARVALDNFDLDRNSMAIVHELLPAYIKLAPAFTQHIASREDLRFMVEAMVRMLRPLEIPLIAQGVEEDASIPVLAALGLAAYQGYAAGMPQPLALRT